MRKPNENDLASRRGAAAEAKAALLNAHRAAKEAAEPTRLERQEERLGVAVARDGRRAERDQAKLEARERLQAEAKQEEAAKLEERERIQAEAMKVQTAIEAAAKAKTEASEKALNDRVARVVEDAAAHKAARDRRYAERKAKQR